MHAGGVVWLLLSLRRGLERVRTALARLAEHHFLFPTITVLVLGVVWGTTAHLTSVELSNAERRTAASTLELADTYEAQLLRNLREIDQTLKVVKYAYESTGDAGVLQVLRASGLLPPDLLFALTLTDGDGRVLSGTRPGSIPALTLQPFVGALAEGLGVGRPRIDPVGSEWKLDFGRRLSAPGGGNGAVILTVDAAYFVSSYEQAKLGQHGVLGLIGAEDGLVRVRRSGETITSGEGAGFILAPAGAAQDRPTVRRVTAWDGTPRLATARPLYGFPLQVLVGLSEPEQLAPVHQKTQRYLLQAAAASAVLLLVLWLLARASRKLVEAVRREHDAKIAHAERVQYLAYHDGLTELPNRAFFSRMLEQSISEARRYNRQLALLFLDLDRFKQINDTLGHQAGDQLLVELARRLKRCLRDSDTVARLGGDEFVVLLPQFDEDKYLSRVAQKLLAVVAEPFQIPGQSLIATTSIGIAVYPRDGEDEQTLMKRADVAMYHAKNQGKDNYQFYSSRLQTNALQRLRLETSLRQALEKQELELHYQPKIDLRTNDISGVEALMRWRSPEHGLVPPADFIPIAEDTGLIVEIGRWALELACSQNVAWQAANLPPICVAVNMSARQFADPRVVQDVADVLQRTGLAPQFLEIEITESMLMDNMERAVRTLTQLSAMGVRLAMDDFGTGYSSLSNLKRFPLTTLKIDRAFVAELPGDTEGRVLTEAIISIGKALSMTVVAEGVETVEQVDALRELICDEYQGFFFSKPVGAQEMAEMLGQRVAVAALGELAERMTLKKAGAGGK